MTERGARWERRRAFVVLAVVALVVASCSEAADRTSAEEAASVVSSPLQTVVTVRMDEPRPTLQRAAEGPAVEPAFEDITAAGFSNPTVIDNEWLPLVPGNRVILDGTTIEAGEATAHRIEFIVTDLVKEIAGVDTVVAWIEDYSDDELVEAELAFYGQDDAGNVWFFGEYPEEYEGGEFLAAPTWIAGVEEAKAGLKMYADPTVAPPAYFQGWGPAVEWSDFGMIDSVGVRSCVALTCYDDVVVIAESSLGEEAAFQLKSYARGVGNVHVDFRGDDLNQEQLEVIEAGPVSSAELERYRAAALAMEKHAYEISPNVYGLTAPARNRAT